MGIRPNTYKRYIPSPTPASAKQLPHPKPLVDRWAWKPGVLRLWVKSPENINLLDNSDFLDWATRLTLKSSSVGLYEDVLDEPSSSSHDVYVVSRAPDGDLELPAHWSVYTRGHFFHLSAETRDASPSDVACGSRMADNGQVITLKDDNYSFAEEPVTSQDRLPTLLVAHQVGQTDYTPSEILNVGHQIINDMASYSLLQRNCQHFMTTLIMNILMRKRDNSVFVGTAKQIADWDLGSKHTGDHCNTSERGCAIVAPELRTSTLKGKFNALVDTEALRRIVISLRRPDGGVNVNSATISPDDYWRAQLAPLEQELATARGHFAVGLQDLREGRWVDAFFGRKVHREVEE